MQEKKKEGLLRNLKEKKKKNKKKKVNARQCFFFLYPEVDNRPPIYLFLYKK
jgi:hypothetical protein